jgi:hypothetical protein
VTDLLLRKAPAVRASAPEPNAKSVTAITDTECITAIACRVT